MIRFSYIYERLIELFFSSYDADESTNRTTSAVESSSKPVEPVAAAVPASAATEEPAAPSYETSPVESYPQNSAPQNDFNSDYHNGSEAVAPVPVAAPPVDQDSHASGTGIKEDG